MKNNDASLFEKLENVVPATSFRLQEEECILIFFGTYLYLYVVVLHEDVIFIFLIWLFIFLIF